MKLIVALILHFNFAYAQPPTIIDLGDGRYMHYEYSGPLLPANAMCLRSDCGPYQAGGYTLFPDGRMIKPDGTEAKWGHIPDDYFAKSDVNTNQPRAGGINHAVGEVLSNNSSAVLSIVNIALHKGQIPLPDSMQREANDIKNELAANENARNEYLPEMNQYLLNSKYEMEEIQKQNSKTILDYLLKNGAKLRTPDYKTPINWDDYVIYKLDEETAALILQQYLNAVAIGNFSEAAVLLPKMLYSNQNFGNIPGVSDNGILTPEKINPSLGPSPLSDATLKTKKNTLNGQKVRNLGNQYQGLWAKWATQPSKFNSLARHEMNLEYLAGLSFLRQADLQFEMNPDLADVLLHLSYEMYEHLRGANEGIKESLEDLSHLLPAMKDQIIEFGKALRENPDKALESTWNLILATPEIAASIGKSLLDATDRMIIGNSYERGRILGGLALDVVINVATAGTAKVTTKVGKAALALGKTTESVRGHLAYERLSKKLFEPLIEQAKVVQRVGNGLDTDKKIRLATSYNALLRSNHPQLKTDAEDIIKAMTKVSDEEFEVLEKVTTSQIDPRNRAAYFNSKGDIDKVIENTRLVKKIVDNEPGREFSGYVARSSKPSVQLANGKVIQVRPEDLNGFHRGSIPSNSRMGIGGPNGVPVLSFGAGPSPSAALDTAQAELLSYYPKLSKADLVNFTAHTNAENILVLDQKTLAKYGVNESMFSERRLRNDSYSASHALGILGRKKFNGILLQSAENPQGIVLQSFKDHL